MDGESGVKEQSYLTKDESTMDALISTHLSVPLSHILALLSLTTLVLIFAYTRMALLLNYSLSNLLELRFECYSVHGKRRITAQSYHFALHIIRFCHSRTCYARPYTE